MFSTKYDNETLNFVCPLLTSWKEVKRSRIVLRLAKVKLIGHPHIFLIFYYVGHLSETPEMVMKFWLV